MVHLCFNHNMKAIAKAPLAVEVVTISIEKQTLTLDEIGLTQFWVCSSALAKKGFCHHRRRPLGCIAMVYVNTRAIEIQSHKNNCIQLWTQGNKRHKPKAVTFFIKWRQVLPFFPIQKIKLSRIYLCQRKYYRARESTGIQLSKMAWNYVQTIFWKEKHP